MWRRPGTLTGMHAANERASIAAASARRRVRLLGGGCGAAPDPTAAATVAAPRRGPAHAVATGTKRGPWRVTGALWARDRRLSPPRGGGALTQRPASPRAARGPRPTLDGPRRR